MKNIETFKEIFYKELESWFSSDIACCDNCYDEFIGNWPAIYLRDLDFQKSGIPLSCFYSGSRLSLYYTEKEFDIYVKELTCPRCDSPLYDNIWPYCIKFEPPIGFEEILVEVNDIAKATPFLLLTHPYAKKTLEEISDLAKRISSQRITGSFFRGKILEPGRQFVSADFTAPPKEKTVEGRYNHTGRPFLYISSNKETCFFELGQPQNGIVVAEMVINDNFKILDLMDDIGLEGTLLQAIIWSSLVSSPGKGEGWYKPQYVFTRFIADCAVKGGVDGIRFPSVRLGVGENLVLFNLGQHGTSLDIKRIVNYSK